MVMWCISAVNRASLSVAAIRRTRSSPFGTSCPALRPARVSLAAFPLARPLSSAASATMVLFGGFAGTTGLSDFPYPSISGVPPQRSLSSPPGDHPGGRARDLPVLAHGDSAHARGLRPRGVRQQLAIALRAMWPSASVNSVGTPVKGISRLNNPACAYPCQCFAAALTDGDA